MEEVKDTRSWTPRGVERSTRPYPRPMRSLLILLCIAAAPLQSAAAQAPDNAANVLVIIGDDMGVDRVAAYGFLKEDGTPVSGPTPTLDRLAGEGVLFRNMWSNPFCSSTRATALTGRYSLRNGIGHYVSLAYMKTRPGMRHDLRVLPSILPETYYKALIGKWHLADTSGEELRSGALHPIHCGFDYHAGSFANFTEEQTYFSWEKLVSTREGSHLETCTTYATIDTTDEAIGVIKERAGKPWFLWVAYNAPHKPLHVPPAELHSQKLPDGNPAKHAVAHTKAMVEALDHEIERLLAAIPEDVMARTTIIFFGDNGTLKSAVEAPFPPKHGKGSPYNGGVNVPFIVAGAAVSPQARGQECQALVNTTDLYRTIAEIIGVGEQAEEGVDSVSFLPYLRDPGAPSAREYLYAERFLPNFIPPAQIGARSNHVTAIRDARYKLIKRPFMRAELYDLSVDYHELNDLNAGELNVEQQAAFKRLREQLNSF